ncbi:MAG: MBL fold metallo-hydrolase, partial [Chloroflexi bacterium]|nr:MBL fold metallo-hydrolase [Chloroflexota bacterium]
MHVLPFVHEGLGNSSYLLELPDGDALVVDPDRSIDRYLRAAADSGRRVVGALETHLHADFVSGAHALASRGEARAYVPAGAAA